MTETYELLPRPVLDPRLRASPLAGFPLSAADAASHPAPAQPMHVVVADADPASRESVSCFLTSSGHSVDACGDAPTAFEALKRLPPSRAACLLVDVRLPGASSFDLHQQLNEGGIYLPVVYVGTEPQAPQVVQAMQKGAIAFLEKPLADEALEQAMALAQQSAGHFAGVRQWRERLNRLTARERQVLALVLKEKLNKQIADELDISKKTVEVHRSNMMEALAARSALHLVVMAFLGRVI
jgi:two-component system response regulator FixJ